MVPVEATAMCAATKCEGSANSVNELVEFETYSLSYLPLEWSRVPIYTKISGTRGGE